MAAAFNNDARADEGAARRLPQALERRRSDAGWSVTAFIGATTTLTSTAAATQ